MSVRPATCLEGRACEHKLLPCFSAAVLELPSSLFTFADLGYRPRYRTASLQASSPKTFLPDAFWSLLIAWSSLTSFFGIVFSEISRSNTANLELKVRIESAKSFSCSFKSSLPFMACNVSWPKLPPTLRRIVTVWLHSQSSRTREELPALIASNICSHHAITKALPSRRAKPSGNDWGWRSVKDCRWHWTTPGEEST